MIVNSAFNLAHTAKKNNSVEEVKLEPVFSIFDVNRFSIKLKTVVNIYSFSIVVLLRL